MDRSQRLSRKARGVLYGLCKTLKQNNTSLDAVVQQTFEYRKEKFRPKQLCALIKNIDTRLTYEQIDDLSKELDPDGNGCVFLAELIYQLKSIREDDDPFHNKIDQESMQIMTKSKLARLSEQEESVLALKQLKDIIRDSDPYQLLDIFDEDRDGFLSVEEFQNMLFNITIQQSNTVRLLLKRIFDSKVRVKFEEVLKALGIQDIAQRISFEEIPNRKSHIHENKPIDTKKRQEPRKEEPRVSPARVSPARVSPTNIQPKPAVNNQPKPQVRHGLTPPKTKEDLLKLSMKRQEIPLHEISPVLLPFVNPSSEICEPLASMAIQYIVENKIYSDPKNPTTKKPCRYMHIHEIFGGEYYLFEEGGQSAIRRQRKGLGMMMEARNIIQGSVGDCYFMSALAGVVEHYPELIYCLFVLDRNPASIYGIRLFIDGAWQTVITDAYFPVNQFGHFLFAKPHNREIWVMLLEKAWAKIYGTFENIHAGFADEGLIALTGAPCEQMLSDADGTIERLKLYLKKGYIISCSTNDMIAQMSDRQQEAMGIFSGHAYSVLKIETDLVKANGQNLTLVRVRNPWGHKEWKGDWSYNSPMWTKELRARLNYTKNPNDGSFYMSLGDYLMYFQRITVCFVSLGKVHSHITLQSDRTHSVMVSFKVVTSGDYFLSLYQQNRRKYQQSSNYKLSKSRLFLGKLVRGKIEAVASKACISENLHLETTLEPGDYVISCKIRWNYHQKNQFVLTSYGAGVVEFHPIPKDKQFLHNFVQSKAALETGQKQYYTKIGLATSYKIVNFDPKQGYGYILYRNKSSAVMQSQMNFNKISGIKPIKPQTLPVKVIIVPGDVVIRSFLIEPTGFGYELSEQVRLS